MTPEYLEVLAYLADPDELWRLPALEQLDLPSEKRKQLDTGVALRRYASHLSRLLALIPLKQSLLITPFTESCIATMTVDMPPEHERLWQQHQPRTDSAASFAGDPTDDIPF